MPFLAQLSTASPACRCAAAPYFKDGTMPPKRAATAGGSGKGKGCAVVSDSEEDASSLDEEDAAHAKARKPAQKRQRHSKGAAASAGRNADSPESLVVRLPRAALEGLLIRVLKGEQVGTSDVEQMVAGDRSEVRAAVVRGQYACP